MKRLTTLVLALCVLTMLLLPAAAADAKPVGVSFDDLAVYIAKGNPEVKAMVQSYQKLRMKLSHDLDEKDELFASGADMALIAGEAMSLQSSIRVLREQLENEERDMNLAAGAALHSARALYVNHFILSERESIEKRALEIAKDDLAAANRKYSLGIIPKISLSEFDQRVRDAEFSLSVASRQAEANLAALSDALGINTAITLSDLPEFDLEGRIAERGLEADLAAYIANSPDVKAKRAILDEAEKTLKRYTETSISRYSYTTAKADYDLAGQKAGRDFPAVYAALRDAYEHCKTAAYLKAAEDALTRAESLCAKGLISRNELTAASRALEDAKSRSELERLNLILSLLEYEYNLLP